MESQFKIAGIIALLLLISVLAVGLLRRSKKATKQSGEPVGVGGTLPSGRRSLDGQIVDMFLFVKASISDGSGRVSQPAWFMIDSGNSACVLNTAFARRAGIRPTGSTQFQAGSTETVPLASDVHFNIETTDGASLSLTKQTVIILDDEGLISSIQGGDRIMSEGYGGVLGMPFLVAYNLIVDYRQGQLQVAPDEEHGQLEFPLKVISGRSATDPAPVNAAYVPIFVGVSGSGPWPTKPSHWLIDLGADKSTISAAGAQSIRSPEWQQALASAPVTGREQLASKTVQVKELSGATLSLQSQAGATTRDLALKIPLASIAGIAGNGGDLGADYLSSLGRVGFFFKNKRLAIGLAE